MGVCCLSRTCAYYAPLAIRAVCAAWDMSTGTNRNAMKKALYRRNLSTLLPIVHTRTPSTGCRASIVGIPIAELSAKEVCAAVCSVAGSVASWACSSSSSGSSTGTVVYSRCVDSERMVPNLPPWTACIRCLSTKCRWILTLCECNGAVTAHSDDNSREQVLCQFPGTGVVSCPAASVVI